MTGDTKGIVMVMKGHKLVFDIVIRTNTGLVYCLYINCMTNELACTSITCRNPWSINDVHDQLGHSGKDTTHKIVKGLNLNVKPGAMETFWACMKGKAEECSAVQPSREEPGPWRESISGPVIHTTTSQIASTANSEFENHY